MTVKKACWTLFLEFPPDNMSRFEIDIWPLCFALQRFQTLFAACVIWTGSFRSEGPWFLQFRCLWMLWSGPSWCKASNRRCSWPGARCANFQLQQFQSASGFALWRSICAWTDHWESVSDFCHWSCPIFARSVAERSCQNVPQIQHWPRCVMLIPTSRKVTSRIGHLSLRAPCRQMKLNFFAGQFFNG